MIHLLFGGLKTEPQEHQGYRIFVSGINRANEYNFVVLSKGMIVDKIPSIEDGPWIGELNQRGILLSDVNQTNEPVSLLIGADILGKLQTGNMLDLKNGPTAIETRLGWSLIGKRRQEETANVDTALVVTSLLIKEADVSQLWNLDVLGIKDQTETDSKEAHRIKTESRIRESVKLDEKKRYQVDLPWKENHPALPSNEMLAKRRLDSVIESLTRKNLLQDYDQVFVEWEQEGIVEEVPHEEIKDFAHYLPHRPVIKEGSTTRLRPVFDASARKGENPSLNQCLEIGLNLIELIPKVLMRFRSNNVGVVSDIKKAFLQISVHPKDRNSLRFLWRDLNDPSKLKIYRHARVVFGVSSSPALLGIVIDIHLERARRAEKSATRSDIIKKLAESLYVDNCVASVADDEERKLFEEVSTEVMMQGKFELRGWEYSQDKSGNEDTSVLGLTWNKADDTLRLNKSALEESLPEKITKRVILSASHKIFDPIGMCCPVLLYPKLLLQQIWLRKLEWDVAVDPEMLKDFQKGHRSLSRLKELRIPHRMFGVSQGKNLLTFHVFVDASRAAYATAVFVRVETDVDVQISLVWWKLSQELHLQKRYQFLAWNSSRLPWEHG